MKLSITYWNFGPIDWVKILLRFAALALQWVTGVFFIFAFLYVWVNFVFKNFRKREAQNVCERIKQDASKPEEANNGVALRD